MNATSFYLAGRDVGFDALGSATRDWGDDEKKGLDYFLGASGLSFNDLIEEIERAQPSNSSDPLARMGLGGDLTDLVMGAVGGTVGWLPAMRAVQNLVCQRPWL